MIQEFAVTFPLRKEEENAVVDYVDRINRTADQDNDKLQEQITALQSLRTSLISEVVTGKRDVRAHPLAQEEARLAGSAGAPLVDAPLNVATHGVSQTATV